MQTSTAEEWESSGDPQRMLEMLGDQLTVHRARLFAAGFLRWRNEEHLRGGRELETALTQVESLLFSDKSQDEKRWEALATRTRKPLPQVIRTIAQLREPPRKPLPSTIWTIAQEMVRRSLPGPLNELYLGHAIAEARDRVGPSPSDVHPGHEWHREFQAAYFDALRPVANLLRCVFPNPVMSVNFDPNWRTETARGIARRIFDTRDFTAMPILADAIQDAGCEEERILTHCRGDGPHTRGCWVLEALLLS